MLKLRLKDDMWPVQACVDTQVWNREFSLDLFGSNPFIILRWDSTNP